MASLVQTVWKFAKPAGPSLVKGVANHTGGRLKFVLLVKTEKNASSKKLKQHVGPKRKGAKNVMRFGQKKRLKLKRGGNKMSKPKTLAEIERDVIFEALKRNDYNKQATARELDITPATIRNKLAKWGVVLMREVIVPIEDTLNTAKEFEPYAKRPKTKLRG